MPGEYTLKDRCFERGVLSGMESVGIIGIDAYLVGGGAVQYYTKDPDLHRPTLDADFQAKNYLRKAQRGVWTHNTRILLDMMGFPLEKTEETHKKHTGAEVKIVDAGGTEPFFVHLDVFSQKYIAENNRLIEAAFERAQTFALPGQKAGVAYRIQAPEDLVYHKSRRLLRGIENKRIISEKERILCIASGLLDDVDTSDIQTILATLVDLRGRNLEETTRSGFENMRTLYDDYRDQKALYDILLLIETHRDHPLFTDPKIIPQNIKADKSLERKLHYHPFI